MTARSTHASPDATASQAQWWKDWRNADYSWEGLANKTVTYRGAEISLQDYWRGEDGALIAEPGTTRRWTRFHCPFVFTDGTLSPKSRWTDADWDDLARAVRARIDGDHGIVLSGCVLRELHLPQNATVRLTAGRTFIGGGLTARDSTIINADFRHVLIRGMADFRHTHFDFDADFTGAQFAAMADFSEASFAGRAVFEDAQFAAQAKFFGVHFLDRALFDRVQCLDTANFYKAAFVRRFSINEACFYGRANFEGATDGDPIAQSPQDIHLTRAGDVLNGTLEAASGPSARSFRSLPKLLARRTIFFDDANLSNRDLLSPSTFQFARFLHRARFHGSDIHASVNFHGTEFRQALDFKPRRLPKYPEELLRLRYLAEPAGTDYAAWKKAFLKGRVELRAEDFTADGYYDGLEASFRTLKQLMEDRRDRVREGEFFNLELRARRKRNDVPWWERVASLIYWAISDYGNSIFRPLAMLLMLYLGLSAVYFVMGEHKDAAPDAASLPHLFSALGFSWNNVFSPFSVLDPQRFSAGDPWARDLVLSGDPAFALGVKVMASLQSLLSLALVFLAGLAGRRRFQIN